MGILEICATLMLTVMAVYALMIGSVTAGLIRTLKRHPLQSAQPAGFVTVIIPVRNEEGNIVRILAEMHEQDYPAQSLEVIVADDYSDDATMEFVKQFAREHPGFPLVTVFPPGNEPVGTGKKRAIERAVAIARGDILLFTDADTCRGTGWISSMVSCFAFPATKMVLGPVSFTREKNLLQRVQSLEFLGLMGTTAGSSALGYPVMCNGANLAYRREAFYQCGGFSGNLRYSSGDDQFMMSAIRKHYGKGSVVFNTEPVSGVSTVPEATLGGFINQRIRWVSKSRGYRDPAVILVGMFTWLTHLLLLTGIVAGIWFPVIFPVAFVLWLAKILLEFPIVWLMMRFFGKRELAGYYFIAQAWQLVYVPLAGLLGLFLPYRWKGRRS